MTRFLMLLLAVGFLTSPGNDGMAGTQPRLSPPVAPAGVTDLSARALTDSAIVLQWTEVRSSNTSIPRYVVRYDSLRKYSWNTATDLLTMGCGAPIVGANTTGGRFHACVVWNLKPDIAYRFQMVAYTGTLNSTAVFGPLSNIAEATTMTRIGPMLVQRPRINKADSVFLRQVWFGASGYAQDTFPLRGWFSQGDYPVLAFVNDSVVLKGYLLVTRP